MLDIQSRRLWRKNPHPRLPGSWSSDTPFGFQLMFSDVVVVG
jgi:hypothetical protein